MLRPVANTWYPAAASSIATPRPTPRLAPVTSAFILVLAHHPDDDALDLDLFRIGEDRLHRGVRRLQADLAAGVAIELLQRDVRSAEQRDDHLAVVGGLAVFDDDEVAVPNLLVDHRIAAHAQDVGVALADEVFRHGDRLARRDGLDRQAGRDVAEHRQLDRPPAGARRNHLDRAAAVPGPLDEALLLKIREVLVD